MNEAPAGFADNRANVVKAGDKGTAITLAARRIAVLEANNVRAFLLQSGFETEPLGVVGEWHVAGFTIAVIAHQDRQAPPGSSTFAQFWMNRP